QVSARGGGNRGLPRNQGPVFYGRASGIFHLRRRASRMSTLKKKIKVLVVDDHPVVRKGLLSCLAGKENLKIVGEASNGAEALKLVKELTPDIVLMDFAMPGMDGLAVTETLRKEAPQTKVLILSMQSSRDPVLRIIKAGA